MPADGAAAAADDAWLDVSDAVTSDFVILCAANALGPDVLEALGVNLDVDEDTFLACLNGAGVAFLFARSHHSAMRHVAPVRATLGIRTIFNLLGPLSNPAGAEYQVLGVFAPEWVRPMAETLSRLGTRRAW